MLELLHLVDSSFSTGAFAHSWGLEYAISRGWVNDASSLHHWAFESLEQSLVPLDAAAVAEAYDLDLAAELPALFALDARLASFRPALSIREAHAQVGRSFLQSVAIAYEQKILQQVLVEVALVNQKWGESSSMQFALAWGVTCALLQIEKRSCLEAFLFSSLRQWAQVAQRIIPIGQNEANKFLAQASSKIKRMPIDLVVLSDSWYSNTSGLDLAAMKHEFMTARYFRS